MPVTSVLPHTLRGSETHKYNILATFRQVPFDLFGSPRSRRQFEGGGGAVFSLLWKSPEDVHVAALDSF